MKRLFLRVSAAFLVAGGLVLVGTASAIAQQVNGS